MQGRIADRLQSLWRHASAAAGSGEGAAGQEPPSGQLEDGYEFAFPADAGWAMRLAEFIVAERSCCPF
ncbi:MAG TPA: hypothetical protein VJ827_08910, partial [Rubrobacter sp.]|nr:hypothetical protein [Rubrobacter sp.]